MSKCQSTVAGAGSHIIDIKSARFECELFVPVGWLKKALFLWNNVVLVIPRTFRAISYMPSANKWQTHRKHSWTTTGNSDLNLLSVLSYLTRLRSFAHIRCWSVGNCRPPPLQMQAKFGDCNEHTVTRGGFSDITLGARFPNAKPHVPTFEWAVHSIGCVYAVAMTACIQRN